MPTLDLPDLTLTYIRERSRVGAMPLVLLHGWPEWSGVWRKMLPGLAARFDVVAPDLRNFGNSVGAPAESVEHYVRDLEALVNALAFERFGIIAHDVGAFVAQEYARAHPDRLTRLWFFNCPHFGIGPRWVENGHVREIWYQSFHGLPLAEELVGASRAATRAYFRHFLSQWSHDPAAFDGVLEEWVDVFSRPGRLAGGFRWYQVAAERRLRAMAGDVPPPSKITTPAAVLWGAHDPVLKAEWRETLHDVFTDVRLDVAENAGHFVHWEQPKQALGWVSRTASG